MIRAIKVGGSRKFIFAWHHKHRDMCTQKAVKSPNVPKSGGSAQLVTFRFVFFFLFAHIPLGTQLCRANSSTGGVRCCKRHGIDALDME